jgi:hypothetical protein
MVEFFVVNNYLFNPILLDFSFGKESHYVAHGDLEL